MKWSDVYERLRYREWSRETRLAALLPGAVTAWHGKRATVLEVGERERDGGRWAVVLDLHDDGRPLHIGGAAEATLPVFTDPYPICSCHGDPWPCNDAFAGRMAVVEQQREQARRLGSCHACGQTRNLGPVRRADEQRRYCRRVGCVQAAEQWQRDVDRRRRAAVAERDAWAEQMRNALQDEPPR